MSKLGDMFLMGQRVSITAKEEASRYDLPQVDVDHLLLALLVGGGPAGRLLRAQGLTLDTARRATEQVRADQIARLGIVPPAAEPRPIRDPLLGEMDWTPRALKLMSSGGDHGELGLLTGLLDEHSGLAREVLAAAEVDVEALRAQMSTSRRSAPGAAKHPAPDLPTPPAPPDSGWRAVSHTGFVMAPVAEVWALVSDATRRPEWDDSISEVEPLESGVWLATWASQRPDARRSAFTRTVAGCGTGSPSTPRRRWSSGRSPFPTGGTGPRAGSGSASRAGPPRAARRSSSH